VVSQERRVKDGGSYRSCRSAV